MYLDFSTDFIGMLGLKNPTILNGGEEIVTEVKEKVNVITGLSGVKSLLKEYIKNRKSKDQKFDKGVMDIFTDISFFRDFKQYCLVQALTGNLKVDNISSSEIINFIEKFKEKYSFNTGMSTTLYEAIIKKFGYSKKNNEQRKVMLDFNSIYHLLSEMYLGENVSEENREIYATKFKKIIDRTFEIVRGNNDYTFEDILGSMLYNITDDYPWFDKKVIQVFFSREISKNVEQNRGKGIQKVEDHNIPVAQYVDKCDSQNILLKYIHDEQEKNRDYGLIPEDITKNIAMFRGFLDYCLGLSCTGEIYSNYSEAEIETSIVDFKIEHFFDIRKSSIYMNNIRKKLNITKGSKEFKNMRRKFKAIYHLSKSITSGRLRKAVDENGNSERDFEHLKGTMSVILDELPNPNLDRIYIALLHDYREDFKGVTYEMIKNLFGKIIADGVEELTKRERIDFLTIEEKDQVIEIEKGFTKQERKKELEINEVYRNLVKKGKMERDKIYFGHLDQLQEDILYVKFADRINNLRTLKGTPNQEIVRKIIQTEKYFLRLAHMKKLQTSGKCKAYDLMRTEIDKLLFDKGIKDLYKNEIVDLGLGIEI